MKNNDVYHLYDDEQLYEPEDSNLTPEQKEQYLWLLWAEQQVIQEKEHYA